MINAIETFKLYMILTRISNKVSDAKIEIIMRKKNYIEEIDQSRRKQSVGGTTIVSVLLNRLVSK